MNEEKLENYIRAGEVIQKARKKARKAAEPGTNIKIIAEEVEGLIREEGLEPAFPVNISIDDSAAHYTPGVKENRVLKEDDVVKIDIGAHSDGYIADTALTVNPSGQHQEMIDAVEQVLEKALDFVEPGKTVGELGNFVEDQIPQEYEVVRNLTGHYIGKYEQHAGVSIPNFSNDSDHVFEVGDAFAIEPFLTDGSGRIKNGAQGNIYKIENERNVRGRVERELLNRIKEFNGLPFTPRWFDDFGARKRMAMKKLVDGGIVHSYPVLNEVNGGTVVQAEHTVVLTEDGKKVTTRR
ncbi:type II methionyl aminopeptidase [Candidatus Nanosalina sp. VS9-1]|uniref:type II methionyl aminopeptidase n=1 Tax=Candidatus Nanosalina sp. VS9-1 TaxID=3388566 RepID=UPI0039E1EC6C